MALAGVLCWLLRCYALSGLVFGIAFRWTGLRRVDLHCVQIKFFLYQIMSNLINSMIHSKTRKLPSTHREALHSVAVKHVEPRHIGREASSHIHIGYPAVIRRS